MATGSARRARRNAAQGSGRGGPREGKPGVAHANRTDLNQPPRAVPNQTYGQAGQQLAAQRAVPLPQQAGPPPPGPGGAPSPAQGPSPAGPPPAPMTPPGSLGPLNAPSARPGEPITAGLNTGPGPGPEALGAPVTSPIDEIRAMYAASPNDDLRRLLSYLDSGA